MDLSKIKTCPTLEIEGVWVPYEDARLLIARLNNPRMAAAYSAKVRPFRGSKIPDGTQEAIMLDLLSSHVLLDWQGITNDGQPFAYTPENAKLALQVKDFAAFVIERAGEAELFRAQSNRDAVAAIAKN